MSGKEGFGPELIAQIAGEKLEIPSRSPWVAAVAVILVMMGMERLDLAGVGQF